MKKTVRIIGLSLIVILAIALYLGAMLGIAWLLKLGKPAQSNLTFSTYGSYVIQKMGIAMVVALGLGFGWFSFKFRKKTPKAAVDPEWEDFNHELHQRRQIIDQEVGKRLKNQDATKIIINNKNEIKLTEINQQVAKLMKKS